MALTLEQLKTEMMKSYILKGKTPRQVDIKTWAQWYEKAKNRVVEQTQFGEVKVSTVFLGINHQYGDGPPLIFETMIFGGPHDEYQERYSTWDEAVAGHKTACEIVKPTTP